MRRGIARAFLKNPAAGRPGRRSSVQAGFCAAGGGRFNCLTWRGITYVCLAPVSQTNMFTIPASISVTQADVDIPVTAATEVEVIDTIVKPVSVVGTVTTTTAATK